jgi:cbb3-type cytochrome oxidase maturation protein
MKMDEGTIALTVSTLAVLLVFIGLLLWGIKSSQFKNVEEPKYRILEDADKEDVEG